MSFFSVILLDRGGDRGLQVELSDGARSADLPAYHLNNLSNLAHYSRSEKSAHNVLDGILDHTIVDDPIDNSDRYLVFDDQDQGWAREGVIDASGDMVIGTCYEEDVLVHPVFSDYILVRYPDEPGQTYGQFFLGKRDPERQISLILDTGTRDLKRAIVASEEAISGGHPDPIEIPKTPFEATYIDFPADVTGRLSFGNNESDGDSPDIYECELYRRGKDYCGSLYFSETPTGLIDIANDKEKFLPAFRAANRRFQKEIEGNDLPF